MSYDIEPRHKDVQPRDTLADFPTGYEVCVTNPPWLSQGSSTRLGLEFANNPKYNDLYKIALDKILASCNHAAVLVPASYWLTDLFADRLLYFVLVHAKMFRHTDHPTGLSIFGKAHGNPELYYDNELIGTRRELDVYTPRPPKYANPISWNDRQGDIAFSQYDTTHTETIGLFLPDRLEEYHERTGHNPQKIHRIGGRWKDREGVVQCTNALITEYRRNTHDAMLPTWKGLRKDGRYRRMMNKSMLQTFVQLGELASRTELT